jgi:Phosphotransferase enzyme family
LLLTYIQIFTDFKLKVMNRLWFGKPDPASDVDDHPDPYPWLEGTRIYRKFGKVVVKCNTKDGVVARKVGYNGGNLKTEAFMGNYAREVAGMKVPAFLGLKTHEEHTIMTTDFDPGEPLDGVWDKLTYKNQASIKQELKQQIQLMRQCRTNHLCCANQHRELDPKIPIPDPYNPCIVAARLKPCADEATFDANEVEMVKRRGPKNYALRLQLMMQELPKDYTGRFVLTHGDLSASNILVQDTNKNDPKNSRPHYVISSIIDWQYSGFFPEYMEYAMAKTRPGPDVWARNLICGLLEEMDLGCSKARIEVEKMVRDPLD